jgi:polyisoprenoid-binding protein YceI
MSNDNLSHHSDTITVIPPHLTGTWKAEPTNSTIAFSVGQMFVGRLRGRFTDFDVTIVAGEDPLAAKVAATINLNSVGTGNATRDHHLHSADYFNTEKYPTAEYHSTAVRHVEGNWLVEGALTLHGVTLPVTLTVEANEGSNDPSEVRRARFTAVGDFNRRDFGISSGIPVVGNKFTLLMTLDAVRQD